MWEKITMMPVKSYFAFTNFMKELKEDERGLSGVVVAVLLILVAVLAVALIWDSLDEWLGELWDKITLKGNSIDSIE